MDRLNGIRNIKLIINPTPNTHNKVLVILILFNSIRLQHRRKIGGIAGVGLAANKKQGGRIKIKQEGVLPKHRGLDIISQPQLWTMSNGQVQQCNSVYLRHKFLGSCKFVHLLYHKTHFTEKGTCSSIQPPGPHPPCLSIGDRSASPINDAS